MTPSSRALLRQTRPAPAIQLLTGIELGYSATLVSRNSDVAQRCNRRGQCRNFSSTLQRSSAATSTATSAGGGKRKALTREQRDFLSSALRVNQAGELAATLIYTAQTPPVVARDPHLRPLMRHMYEQEEGHLKTFNSLIARHRVRPTALYPLWGVLATGLGWSTAVMGRAAAMACTEAVETEIGEHYNGQIRRLLEMVAEWEAEGYEVGDDLKTLIGTLREDPRRGAGAPGPCSRE